MSKKIRKAVRTFLIKKEQVVVIKYKTEKNKDYFDIPGGGIEDGEIAEFASIREFKEETGIEIVNQIYKGNVIVEYPNMIFEFFIFLVTDYQGEPKETIENQANWYSIKEVLKEEKKFPTLEILNHLKEENIFWKLTSDEKHHILNIEEYKK